jgi:hypothetical protein
VGEVGEEIGEGCLYALFDALPWQWSLALLVVILVVWLLLGHPGF